MRFEVSVPKVFQFAKDTQPFLFKKLQDPKFLRDPMPMLGKVPKSVIITILRLVPFALQFSTAFNLLATDLSETPTARGRRRHQVLMHEALHECLGSIWDIEAIALILGPWAQGTASKVANDGKIMLEFETTEDGQIELAFPRCDDALRADLIERTRNIRREFFDQSIPPGDEQTIYEIYDDDGSHCRGFLGDLASEGERIGVALALFSKEPSDEDLEVLKILFNVVFFGAWLTLRADRYQSRVDQVTDLVADLKDEARKHHAPRSPKPSKSSVDIRKDLVWHIQRFSSVACSKIEKTLEAGMARVYFHDRTSRSAWCLGTDKSEPHVLSTDLEDVRRGAVSIAAYHLGYDHPGDDDPYQPELRKYEHFVYAPVRPSSEERRCREAKWPRRPTDYGDTRVYKTLGEDGFASCALASSYLEQDASENVLVSPLIIVKPRVDAPGRGDPLSKLQDIALELSGSSVDLRWRDPRGTALVHINHLRRIELIFGNLPGHMLGIEDSWMRQWQRAVRDEVSSTTSPSTYCQVLATAVNAAVTSIFLPGRSTSGTPVLWLLAWSLEGTTPAIEIPWTEDFSDDEIEDDERWGAYLAAAAKKTRCPCRNAAIRRTRGRFGTPIFVRVDDVRPLFADTVWHGDVRNGREVPEHVTNIIAELSKLASNAVTNTSEDFEQLLLTMNPLHSKYHVELLENLKSKDLQAAMGVSANTVRNWRRRLVAKIHEKHR